MRITFNPEAVDYLSSKLKETGKQLKFLHDIEGCGCAVNGVPALALIDNPTQYDLAGEADPLPFYYEPHHKVYYEDHMRISYNPQTFSFSLKSDSQVYSFNLRLVISH